MRLKTNARVPCLPHRHTGKHGVLSVSSNLGPQNQNGSADPEWESSGPGTCPRGFCVAGADSPGGPL